MAEDLIARSAGEAERLIAERRPNFGLRMSTLDKPVGYPRNSILLGWKVAHARPTDIIDGVEHTADGLFLSLDGALWRYAYEYYPYLPSDQKLANAIGALDTVEDFLVPRQITDSEWYTFGAGPLDIAAANIEAVKFHLRNFRYRTDL
jgi:hypothetical protein